MRTDDDFSNFENEWFRPVLLADEYVLWHGMPEQRSPFTKQDIFLIPFSLIWGGGVVFWELNAIKSGAPLLFAIFGIPFVLIGLYLIFGRFIYIKYAMKHTYYAVTNRRVLRCLRKRIEARPLDSLPFIEISYEKDGMGTITFDGRVMPRNARGIPVENELAVQGFAFVHIAEAQKVYALITKARADLTH